MSSPEEIFQQRVTAVLETAARTPNGILGLTAATDADLPELVRALQRASMSVQGMLAAVSGEISRRSSGSGDASLARRLGYRSTRSLIAGTAGVSFGDASRLVGVGEAIRPRVSIAGEDLPAERAHIAGATLAGVLPLGVAQLIDETVEKVEYRLILDQASDLERGLVEEFLTGTHSYTQFTAHCAQIIELLDPDGTTPRDEALRKQSKIQETWLPNGMLRIVAELDPEAAAFYLAAVRARTNPRRPDPTPTDADADTNADADLDAAGGEQRSNVTDIGSRRDRTQPTPTESKVAAFISIMRDALKAEDGKQAGVDTTILVRIDLQHLLSGIGTATIDGIRKPIPASAARRLAVEADLIPQVFDGKSVLLDQGESKRRFTRAQRYAILANYTGCTFPGCDIPTSMVEFHHIGQWATRHTHGKGTDVDNGIPLCGFHNRLMETGWDIQFDDDRVPWFVPPPTIDLFQRPRRGGNLLHRPAA